MNDRSERLDFADRWISDAFDAAILPVGVCVREVDMGHAMTLLERVQVDGRRSTPTALVLRAVALALTRLPQLHGMIVGKRRYSYDRVDLCLSVAGQSAMAPRLILRDAGNKTWLQLAAEVRAEAPKARTGEQAELDRLRRWGWIVPGSMLRRAVLRWMRTLPRFREQKLGTFQVSVLTDVDLVVPMQFGTAAMVGVAGIRDRVVAREGSIVVRPTVMITCSFNHKVWDGLSARNFLGEVANILEGGVLEKELPQHCESPEHPAPCTT